MLRSLVGSEMCIRDRPMARSLAGLPSGKPLPVPLALDPTDEGHHLDVLTSMLTETPKRCSPPKLADMTPVEAMAAARTMTPGAYATAVGEAVARVPTLPPETVKWMLQQRMCVVLDTRSPEECRWLLPGALSIPFGRGEEESSREDGTFAGWVAALGDPEVQVVLFLIHM
eukprot:TRINITY_DN52765_c0_g1_i1.p2 TRINITY_DN52765_c0_g1~~TRINITY_DN52765_c0_g1_i1.p2  ORF type:complete len:187 (-),score=48.17 TRINITY_DN52765_c0_g1_i1:80-592(-)